MICDFTGMEVANASLLDEGTAAAEALALTHRHNKRKKLFLSDQVHPQTIGVIATRAASLGLTLEVGDVFKVDTTGKDIAGILVQYPDTTGSIHDFDDIVARAHANGVCTYPIPILNIHAEKKTYIYVDLSFIKKFIFIMIRSTDAGLCRYRFTGVSRASTTERVRRRHLRGYEPTFRRTSRIWWTTRWVLRVSTETGALNAR